jgi:hypothetical protein
MRLKPSPTAPISSLLTTRARVEIAAAHAHHRRLHVGQRGRHAARDEERQADRGDEPSAEQEGDRDRHVVDEGPFHAPRVRNTDGH